MSPLFSGPWKPFKVISWDGQDYPVCMQDIMGNNPVTRRRFMSVFPDGRKWFFEVAVTEVALQDHAEAIDELVTEAIVKEIKAVTMAPPPVHLVSADMKLEPLHEEQCIHIGVDFAKLEGQMVASMFKGGALPSDEVYGPSVLGPLSKIVRTQQVMENAFRKFAASYAIPAVTFDSLTGLSKAELFKASYGGVLEQTELTSKGLATLKRFGVLLVG